MRLNNTQRPKPPFRTLFLALFIPLTATFILLDCTNAANSSVIKFAIVILCFSMSLLGGERLLLCAIFFTVISDFLLLFTSYFVQAVVVFSFAHLSFIARNTRTRLFLALFVPVALCWTIAAWLSQVDLLIFVSGWYGCCLIGHVVSAILYKHSLRIIGAILFLMCDIWVLLYNLPTIGVHINPLVVSLAPNIIWIFYAPSLACLTLSRPIKEFK